QLVEVAQCMFVSMVGINKYEIYGRLILEENWESFGNITKNQLGVFIFPDVFPGDLYEFLCPLKCIKTSLGNFCQITGVDAQTGSQFDYGRGRGKGAEVLIQQAVFFGRAAIACDVCYLSLVGAEL